MVAKYITNRPKNSLVFLTSFFVFRTFVGMLAAGSNGGVTCRFVKNRTLRNGRERCKGGSEWSQLAIP
jgi:hypothetical protein